MNNKAGVVRAVSWYDNYCSLAAMICVFLLALNIAPANADGSVDPHALHKKSMAMTHAKSNTQIQISDVNLIDRFGKKVNFKQDIISDNIVVIDFVYTSCTTVCPVLTAVMSNVAEKLSNQLNRNVLLVSLSVDPTRDNPQRLNEFAKKVNSGQGWIWLTGDKPDVDHVLQDFGVYTPDFVDHPSVILVGEPRSGKWTRFFGFPDPDKIIASVNSKLQARTQTTVGQLTGE